MTRNDRPSRSPRLATIVLAFIIAGLSLWAAFRRRPASPDQELSTRPAAESSADQSSTGYVPAGLVGGAALFAKHLADIAVGPDNRLYAAGDRRIEIFGHDCRRVGGFALPGRPVAVAVTGDAVYVAFADRVERFTTEGASTAVLGADAFLTPTGLAVDEGRVLVADGGSGRVIVFGPAGAPCGVIAPDGGEGRFRLPNRRMDVALDTRGNAVVTHSGPHRVETYSPASLRTASFGRYDPTDPAAFPGCCNPVGIAVGPRNIIVVAQKAPACVKIFTPAGALLGQISPDYFHADNKHMAVAVDAGGKIYVADTRNRRVRMFTPES